MRAPDVSGPNPTNAISFVDWPLDLSHNFLYFLASLIEVMAFSYLSDPARWFAFMCAFLIVAAILYWVDLFLIRSRSNKFNSPSDKKLYEHILTRQKFELKFLVPTAVIFAGFCFIAILDRPDIFIIGKWHILLVGIQTAFAIFVLSESIRSFSTRAKLVTSSRSS